MRWSPVNSAQNNNNVNNNSRGKVWERLAPPYYAADTEYFLLDSRCLSQYGGRQVQQCKQTLALHCTIGLGSKRRLTESSWNLNRILTRQKELELLTVEFGPGCRLQPPHSYEKCHKWLRAQLSISSAPTWLRLLPSRSSHGARPLHSII